MSEHKLLEKYLQQSPWKLDENLVNLKVRQDNEFSAGTVSGSELTDVSYFDYQNLASSL